MIDRAVLTDPQWQVLSENVTAGAASVTGPRMRAAEVLAGKELGKLVVGLGWARFTANDAGRARALAGRNADVQPGDLFERVGHRATQLRVLTIDGEHAECALVRTAGRRRVTLARLRSGFRRLEAPAAAQGEP